MEITRARARRACNAARTLSNLTRVPPVWPHEDPIVHRTRSLAVYLLGLLVLAGVSQIASAQDSRPRRVSGAPAATETPSTQAPADNPNEPVSLDAALVEVPVVVADRSGRYVPGLTAHDFELSEDGVLQQIVFFRDDRVPIHVAILLDTSNSTRGSLTDIQDAAIEFTNQLLPGDRIMVMSFDADVRVDQDFTSDRSKLVRAIRNTKPQKGTKLYDAVLEAVARRFKGIDGRKAIVLLSDGRDHGSDHAADEAIQACVESDVMVYGIRYPAGLWKMGMPGQGQKKNRGIQIPNIPNIPGVPRIPGLPWPLVPQGQGPSWGGGLGGDFMEVVTANSGGRLFDAAAITDLRALLGQVAEELRHVYTLAYQPSNAVANGGYRSVIVTVPAQPDLTVRHRLGYQAKP